MIAVHYLEHLFAHRPLRLHSLPEDGRQHHSGPVADQQPGGHPGHASCVLPAAEERSLYLVIFNGQPGIMYTLSL